MSIAKGKAGGDEVEGVVVVVVVCASNLLVHGGDSKVGCQARCEGSNGREKKVDRKEEYSKRD
jgi:hypothetical protein